MFSLQLYLTLAVLLHVSHGSEAQQANVLRCAYHDENFCYQVKASHAVNQQALKRLVGDLDGEGKRKLAEADELVLELLTKEKEVDLLHLSKKTLKAELGALVWVKIDCFTPKAPIEPAKEINCRAVYDDIGYAIEKLIEAIIEVQIDASKKSKIRKLYDKFYEEKFLDPSTNFANEMHALGKEIWSVM